MSKPLLAALLCLGLVGTCGDAAAKLTSHPRECQFSIGPAQMMFSAFQTKGTDEIFCRHLPAVGQTLLILDAEQTELRDMVVELFVVRDVGQKAWNDDLDANLVARSEPKKFFARSGTMTYLQDFAREGAYLAVVRAVGDGGAKEYVGAYPFTVGDTQGWYAASALVAAAVGFVAFGLWRRRENGPAPAAPGGGPRPHRGAELPGSEGAAPSKFG